MQTEAQIFSALANGGSSLDGLVGREVHLGCVSQQEGARALDRFVIGLAPVRTHDLLRADGWIFEQTTCPQRSSPGFLSARL